MDLFFFLSIYQIYQIESTKLIPFEKKEKK